MRFLTILAIVATLLWGGYWFVGSRALDRAITAGLQALPQVQVAGHSVSGFPNRFDVTFDQPRLSGDGVTWSSDFVQVFALSYQPNHLVVVFAHDQALEANGMRVALRSDDLRASAVMTPGLTLPLDRFTLIGRQLVLQADGQSHQVDTLRLGTRQPESDDSGRVHEAALVLEQVFPDSALLDRFDPGQVWPRVLNEVRVEGVVTLDRPLDRRALEGRQPQVQDLSLTRLGVSWDGVQIDATGDLRLDAQGRVIGDLRVRVTGWQALVQAMGDAGAIPQDQVGFVSLAFQGLRMPDNPERIEAPLSFDAGTVRLGPVTLGTLPPLR